MIRPAFFRRTQTTTTTTQRPTTSTAKASSGPTRTTPKIAIKPFRKYLTRTTTRKPIESQVTTGEPKKQDTRNRLFSRRPVTKNPQQKHETPINDNHHASTDAEETTALRDLAIALKVIQHAPLPSASNKDFFLEYPETTTVAHALRVSQIPRWSSKSKTSRPKITTRTASPIRLSSQRPTTRYFSPNDQPPTASPDHSADWPDEQPAFYRVSTPSLPLRHHPLDEDFYLSGSSRLPTHSKVLLHGSGVIECLDQGSFPHPVSCRKFISCARMDDAKILGWEYTCPKRLSFDPIGGMCNWSAGLGCDEM